MDERPVLELRGITKRFPGIVANDGVDFDLRKGEVHALLGENGAGKSTLMNVLYGLYRPDEGEILINGKPAELGSPKASIENGVGMVHQHFMLIPVMTVAENIVLATEPVHNGVLLDYDVAAKRVEEISTRFGLAVDPRAYVRDITVGQQQRVEILKALYRGADILVLDEPTAVLTPQEAHELFAIVKSLTDQGKSIIFISHKLNEVAEIADRITVLRRGKKIETLPAAGATEEGLARLMVGREVLLRVDKGVSTPTSPLLQVEGLTVEDDRGHHQGEERLVRGPRRRDRRDRRRRRQRADGADRRARRAAAGHRGQDPGGRRGRHRRGLPGVPRRRPRPYPGGPPAPRARARLLAGREHRPARLRPPAVVAVRLALPEAPAARKRRS